MGLINFKKFKFFVLDIISFGSSQAIAANLAAILIILLLLPVQTLEHLPTISLYSSIVIPYFFNNSCPEEGFFKNCGFYSVGQTRALSSVLHGDLKSALEHNPLVLILLFALLGVLAFNLYKIYKLYRKTGKIYQNCILL